MRKFALYVLIMGVLLVASSAGAQQLGIVTGATNGTYYKFGQNIGSITRERGLNINVMPSSGSVSIVRLLATDNNADVGIVQSDVLYFIQQLEKDPNLRDRASKLRIVFPLYDEEIHILARSGITSFRDLHNRKVAIGRPESGTILTTQALFRLSGVQPQTTYQIDSDEALSALRRGVVDAMVFVAGQPAQLFEGINKDEGLHFVPVFRSDVGGYYKSTYIRFSSYRWMGSRDVPAIAVKAILMSFNYESAKCDAIGKMAKLIRDNFECLKFMGHPKWAEVDLNQFGDVGQWQRYSCVTRALQSGFRDRVTCPCYAAPNSDRIALCKLEYSQR